MGVIRANDFKNSFFIKPFTGDKTFTGYVVKSIMDIFKLRNIPDEFEILLSEYRVFIIDGEIIGCKNYTGDFEVLPDFKLIRQAVDSYKDQKKAYSLDFGIMSTGETALIEINDAFGIAPYGLETTKYLRLLQTRWDEIMNTRDY